MDFTSNSTQNITYTGQNKIAISGDMGNGFFVVSAKKTGFDNIIVGTPNSNGFFEFDIAFFAPEQLEVELKNAINPNVKIEFYKES